MNDYRTSQINGAHTDNASAGMCGSYPRATSSDKPFGVVYGYEFPNGKWYIGKSRNPHKRHLRHLRGDGTCKAFHNALKKHGEQKMKILWRGYASDFDLAQKEISFIAIHRAFGDGYNMTKGGEGVSGFTHKDTTKMKMSRWHTGKKLSPKTKLKLSVARTGKTMTAETKRKISQSQKERWARQKGVVANV